MTFYLDNRLNLYKSFNGPNDQSQKKNNDGNFINTMHHSQIQVGFLAWVRFLKNSNKVIADFA